MAFAKAFVSIVHVILGVSVPWRVHDDTLSSRRWRLVAEEVSKRIAEAVLACLRRGVARDRHEALMSLWLHGDQRTSVSRKDAVELSRGKVRRARADEGEGEVEKEQERWDRAWCCCARRHRP